MSHVSRWSMKRVRDPLFLCFVALGLVLAGSMVRLALWFHRIPRSTWRHVRWSDLPDEFTLYLVLLCQLLPVCLIGWVVRFREWKQLPEQCKRLFLPGGGWRPTVYRRMTTRLCPVCGYDVRYSDGICTECGSPAPVASRRTLATRVPPSPIRSPSPRQPPCPGPPPPATSARPSRWMA